MLPSASSTAPVHREHRPALSGASFLRSHQDEFHAVKASRPCSPRVSGLVAVTVLPLTARRVRRSNGHRRSWGARRWTLMRCCGDGEVKLPPSACKGQISGVEVYIIGTAHISAQSAADVKEVLSQVQPDAVVVELSRDRISSLYHHAPSGETTGSVELELDRTAAGFPVVLSAKSSAGEDGQLIIRNIGDDQVDVVNMSKGLSSFSDGKWLETAFEKHRYRSNTLKIWPAIELMISMANRLFPLAQRAFYSSVSNVSHSGGEFAAAAQMARASGCPIILGDVENEDLFDPLGALEVTKEDPLWVRLGGPFVRPPSGGVDFVEALKHVCAGITKPGTGARIGGFYVILLVGAFYLDEHVNAADLQQVVPLLLAMSTSNTLVAATIVFLLTATRDERLFRAVREAAETVQKKGRPCRKVVLVCGAAHVNGVARHLAKAETA